MKPLSAFIFLALFYFSNVFAVQAQGLPGGDFSELKLTGHARVISVIDPLTVQLDDKTTIRLTGIEYPDFAEGEPGAFSLVALKIIKDMLEGQSVNIYQTKNESKGRVNRMGHRLAQLERQSDNAWVQGTMIALGLAIARTSGPNPEMASQIYTLEAQARQDKAGVWNMAAYKILTPDEAARYEDSVRIVEGTIRSATLKNNRAYLNFGADWRKDFTVSIAPENKRAFSKAGIDLLQLNGKRVRVRGWIEDYNGPMIEIDHPQALEIIKP